jgi:hypothetical protein
MTAAIENADSRHAAVLLHVAYAGATPQAWVLV